MDRRQFLVGIGVLVVAGCGGSRPGPGPTPIDQPPPPPPPPPPQPAPVLGINRILTFGDSMTAGTTSPAVPQFRTALSAGIPFSYPFKLSALLTQRYSNQEIVVLNGGIAGKKATEDRSRIGGVMAEADAELLVLMEGANDLLSIFIPPVPESPNAVIRGAVDAMEDMVREAMARRMEVIVVNLPPQRESGPRGAAAKYVGQYNSMLQQMAAKKGARFVDLHSQFDLSLIGVDGLHPTEAGYERVAEVIRTAIGNAFERPA
jgi:lysophospholipase L1-like esterase